MQRRRVAHRRRFQRVDFRRRQRKGDERLARDGVAQRAAVEINQTQIEIARVRGKEARQQLVGIARAEMDLRAGVAAFQPLQRQTQMLITGGTASRCNGSVAVKSMPPAQPM